MVSEMRWNNSRRGAGVGTGEMLINLNATKKMANTTC